MFVVLERLALELVPDPLGLGPAGLVGEQRRGPDQQNQPGDVGEYASGRRPKGHPGSPADRHHWMN